MLREINFSQLHFATPYRDTPEGRDQEIARSRSARVTDLRLFRVERLREVEPAIDYTAQYLEELAARNREES